MKMRTPALTTLAIALPLSWTLSSSAQTAAAPSAPAAPQGAPTSSAASLPAAAPAPSAVAPPSSSAAAPAPPAPGPPAPAPAPAFSARVSAQMAAPKASAASPPPMTGAPRAATTQPEAREEADLERRVVVFTDGPAPRIVASGGSHVRGPVELEVRFRNANPLCYEYTTNIAATRVAASELPLPERVPGIGALGAPTSTAFSGLEEALAAMNTAQTDLDEMLNALRIQVSLDDVWAACDGGGDFATQRSRVESAARAAAQRLGASGAWRRALEQAETVSLAVRRLSRELEAGEHDAAQEVDARKTALGESERKEQDERERAARTGRTKKVQAELDDTARELAASQRRLREAELKLGKHRRAPDLARSAERLEERVRGALETLGTAVMEINRARALLARSPTAIRRTFGEGETISVVVERTRLDRGERVAGRGPQSFAVPAFVTLRPVFFDIGIGPALGIGHNTRKYETRWVPEGEYNPTPSWRVVQTEQGLPLDAMISVSAYIWKLRYFDDVVFDLMQLLPRPMIGISLAHPLDVLYAGLQVDPLQYLDISGGVRIANEDYLVGPKVMDRALVDDGGNPVPPLTRRRPAASAFVAVTVSTNLVYDWLLKGL